MLAREELYMTPWEKGDYMVRPARGVRQLDYQGKTRADNSLPSNME